MQDKVCLWASCELCPFQRYEKPDDIRNRVASAIETVLNRFDRLRNPYLSETDLVRISRMASISQHVVSESEIVLSSVKLAVDGKCESR